MQKMQSVTDRRTDGPTDRRTDRTSYRDATAHLKIGKAVGERDRAKIDYQVEDETRVIEISLMGENTGVRATLKESKRRRKGCI